MNHQFSGSIKIAEQTHEITGIDRKDCHAFYYLWPNDWNSTKMLGQQPATLYAEGDVNAYDRHIIQAKGVGIDGFLVSYWGSHNRENYTKLVDVAKRHNFQINPYIEAWGFDGKPRGMRLMWEEIKWLSETHNPDIFAVFVSEVLPNDMWARIIDQSLHDTEFICGNPHDEHFDGLEVFNGCHIYNPAKIPISEMERQYCLIGESVRFIEPNMGWEPKTWNATVMPEFNESGMPERKNPLIVDGDGGRYLRQSFDAAIASDPDRIFITSWNEWPEHSAIEPSRRDGDLYLQITQEKLNEWRR